MIHRFSLTILLLVLVAGWPARADFFDGLAAYDAGDYYATYLEWLPLAKAGDGDAQSAIADLYLSELLTVPAGPNERRRIQRTTVWWYRQAAQCGHTVAQLNLGDLYANGIGVAADPVQAWLWLGLAARAGNAWAAQRQVEVGRIMTPAELTEGQSLLGGWAAPDGCRQ
ncbi:MAG: sel1 repeat family protein [Alphaproteobacteria bacterium]|nr:sel1 repeat family protein [Alphaproteobacteria bacterium]MCK5622264.1 sel1 repeat family protein [Alphaproteobacteria bacterium]